MCLFFMALSVTKTLWRRMVEKFVNKNLEFYGKIGPGPNFRYDSALCLKGLGKTMNNPIQDSLIK